MEPDGQLCAQSHIGGWPVLSLDSAASGFAVRFFTLGFPLCPLRVRPSKGGNRDLLDGLATAGEKVFAPPAMMAMAILLQLQPPSWNVLALICAVLLLTALIPLERFRKHEELAKEKSKRAWFSNLQKELAETRDIKQLGEQALGLTLQILGTTGGCVLLQGDPGRDASYKNVQGLSSRTADLLTAQSFHPYLAMAAERWGALMVFSDLHKPEVVTAWQRDPLSNGFIGIMKAEGLRSAVLIGLGMQGRCYGALLAGSRKAQLLKSYQLRLALLMGHLVSGALESWARNRTEERHKQEFRAFYRMGLALRETFDFKTQIEILRREMKDLLGEKDFAFSLQSSPTGALETMVPFKNAREVESSLDGPTSKLEEQVVRTRSPLVVSVDWRGAARGSENVAGGPRKRSWCGVHIALSDGTAGVLAMVDYHSAITEKELELFQVVANEATKAFENARTFQRERERASSLGLLNELGQKAALVVNPKDLLPDICQQAQTAFGYELAHIDILHWDRRELVVEAEAGYGGELLGRRIALGEGLAGAAAETGESLVADFLATEAKYVPLQPGIRSGVSVPLKIQNQILGVFSLESRREHAFSSQDVLTTRALADQLAIALHNARTYQAAFEQAITDGLTGLKTHRYFMEAVEREWRRSTRSGQEFSVIMLDLDQFKEVNDRYGHRQGDRVLRAVADVLSETVRQSSVVARYGGDEFSILMPEATAAQAGTLAERMRAKIESDPLLKTHGVTASFGIGTFPVHGPTNEEVIRMADASMYLAKNQSGNCVCVGPLTPASMNAGWEPGVLAANFEMAPGQVFRTGSEAFNEYLNRIEQASRKATGEMYLLDTVTSLARSVDFSDHYTRDHGQAVSRWAVRIARQLGLSHEDVEEVRLAGVLHDIGKVGIPFDVLSKPARLTPEEYEVMKNHSVLGERILAPLMMGSIRRISRMVRHHHETFDGNGYPDRLKGESIPLGARILAIADSFDTIISDRAYKMGLSYKDGIFELHRCRGTQFDPQLVDSLVRSNDDQKSLDRES
jgi:diguanylate cyclase (GGDEF)-like protein